MHKFGDMKNYVLVLAGYLLVNTTIDSRGEGLGMESFAPMAMH